MTSFPATLSVATASRLLGINPQTAYAAVKRGDLPSIRVGKRILIPSHRLAALLDGEPPAKQSNGDGP